MLLGAIADDLTGATDLALMLSREGMRTIQTIGVPKAGLDLSDVDAVVVALKSRTNPAAEAVAMSLEALSFLQRGGRSSSCSNIARPSIPVPPAISAPSPKPLCRR